MSSGPLISVITPTLNSATTIEECLSSVANQTYRNIEHLIIDGLSSDPTLDIIKKYEAQFSHIQLFSEKDSGIYDAMNKGIKLAKGEWLYFLGGDDKFYDKNILQKVFKSPQSKMKILYGNVFVDGDTDWAKNGDIYDGPFTLEKILKKNICHQAMFYHRSVFKTLGVYFTRYIVCSDWDFNLKCFAKIRFTYLPETIAYFKGGNVSTLISDKTFEFHFWRNIARYFKWQLYKKEFTEYLSIIRSNERANDFNCKCLILFIINLIEIKNKILFRFKKLMR